MKIMYVLYCNRIQVSGNKEANERWTDNLQNSSTIGDIDQSQGMVHV